MAHMIVTPNGCKTKPYDVEEYCPHCDDYVCIRIDRALQRHSDLEVTCPVCHHRLMICSACPNPDACDWNDKTGCRIQRRCAEMKSEKTISSIRDKYSSAYDVIFLAAVQLVHQLGTDLCMSEEWLDESVAGLNAIKPGENRIVSKNAEIGVLKCAHELAQFSIMDIMAYIQEYVQNTVIGSKYVRLRKLLFGCMEFIDDDSSETNAAYRKLHNIGFTDTELDQMGFGYLLDTKEEQNDSEL